MPHLAQLIYRSKATPLFRRGKLDDFVNVISRSNERQNLTGALLFDGDYFLQIIEGTLSQLEALLGRLRNDIRHTSVVVLRLDIIKERAFCGWGMSRVTLRHPTLEAALASSPTERPMWSPELDLTTRGDERLQMVVNAFLQGRWRDEAMPNNQPTEPVRISPARKATRPIVASCDEVGFAFQPIVDTQKGSIRTLEALIRGPRGESAAEVLGRYQGPDVYPFDLRSKAVAIEQFAALDTGFDLALNLLPLTLTHAPKATEFLFDALDRHGIAPERLIVEVTEEEAITCTQRFIEQMQSLRAMGVRVAIDDFGAGFAGLSLLTQFQPDKLKIDRALVRDIHHLGPSQAIVRAVVQLCVSLGIDVVAEGVERLEELLWLEGIGIQRFQGFLLSRPEYGGVGEVRWFR